MSKAQDKVRQILLSAARGTGDEEVITALVDLASEHDKMRHETEVEALKPFAMLAEEPGVDGKRLSEAIAEGDSAAVAIQMALLLAPTAARNRSVANRANVIAEADAVYTVNGEKPCLGRVNLSQLCSRQAFINQSLRDRGMELLSEVEARSND